jgi:hypothetical protein
MIWNDAVTVTYSVSGIVNVTVFDEPNTILGVAMQQSNNSSATTVKCGNAVVARNYATNFSNVEMNYNCDNDLVISKTGNDEATVIITYVDRLTNNYSTTTQFGLETYNPTKEISSSSDIAVYGSMSAGEILIATVLLFGIIIYMMSLLAQSLFVIKTKRKYLEYSGGDVERTEI